MKRHILFLSCLLLLVVSSICYGENQAGFDCKKASTPTEKIICSDFDLSLNDAVLAEDYNNGMKFLSSEEKSKLKSEQKAWLGKRDKDCKQSQDTESKIAEIEKECMKNCEQSTKPGGYGMYKGCLMKYDVYERCMKSLEDAKQDIYGIDKGCLRKMYEDRIKELHEKILGLKRLDVKLPRDLQLFIDEKLPEALTGSSPAYYYRISNHQYILEYFDGILYVDTKKKDFDTIIRGNIGESIEGAIRGGGITWLIASSATMHQGAGGRSYQAIMIKDKKSDNEPPYQLLDLAGVSASDHATSGSNPCADLEDDDNGSFSDLKGYDVKDVNGDGINDMVFHIEGFDCATNKKTSIKETYYFLPKKPFIKSTVQTRSSKLPEFIPRVGHSGGVNSVAFSPDGRYALSGSSDTTMKLWDIATGKEIKTFRQDSYELSVDSVAFSPDGRYALSGTGSKMKLWDIATAKEIKTFECDVDKIAFSPDGRYALSAGGVFDHTIKLWDIASGKLIRTFKGHYLESQKRKLNYNITSVAYSPDGHYALSGSNDRSLKLWDIATGKEIRTFKGHMGRITSCVFSPDGRYVLSGSLDKTMKLWDVATGKEIRIFTGHSDIVTSVAFSPDGRYALSGSSNQHSMKLWDINTGKEIRIFKGHSDIVTSVAYSPDGRYALSGSDDRSLKLWDINTGKLIRTFGHAAYIKSASKKSGDKNIEQSDSTTDQQNIKMVDVNTRDKDGDTSLIRQSREGNIEEVQKLLAAKADVNAKNKDGKTALMEASASNNVDVVQELLAARADVNIRDKDNETALFKASWIGNISIVQMLLASNADVNVRRNDGFTALLAASLSGNVAVVRALLVANADVNARDENGTTAVMLATYNGYVEMLPLLQDAEADMNARANDSYTALMKASKEGNTKEVRDLLAAGADVNVGDNKGNTALMAASITIYVDVVKKLLEAGADINAKNKDGVTALMLASGYGRTGLVVTDMKGKMEIANKDPLGNVEIVKALIAAKADVNIRSGKNGRTALMGASRFGSLAVIKELIAAGADVNIKDNEGCTALIEASRYGYTDVVRELLAARADVNIKSSNGVTALTEASKGYDEIVKLLKEAGAK
jgi:WD40 repeat protein/ankyrin repeat protein/uncharacterized protein YecT (DUF1311 family)